MSRDKYASVDSGDKLFAILPDCLRTPSCSQKDISWRKYGPPSKGSSPMFKMIWSHESRLIQTTQNWPIAGLLNIRNQRLCKQWLLVGLLPKPANPCRYPELSETAPTWPAPKHWHKGHHVTSSGSVTIFEIPAVAVWLSQTLFSEMV